MSAYSVVSDRCELPALDAQNRAIICGKPATTTRTTFDVTFSACEACALAIDARDAKAGCDARLRDMYEQIGRLYAMSLGR